MGSDGLSGEEEEEYKKKEDRVEYRSCLKFDIAKYVDLSRFDF
jgi:hypothetical protein